MWTSRLSAFHRHISRVITWDQCHSWWLVGRLLTWRINVWNPEEETQSDFIGSWSFQAIIILSAHHSWMLVLSNHHVWSSKANGSPRVKILSDQRMIRSVATAPGEEDVTAPFSLIARMIQNIAITITMNTVTMTMTMLVGGFGWLWNLRHMGVDCEAALRWRWTSGQIGTEFRIWYFEFWVPVKSGRWGVNSGGG